MGKTKWAVVVAAVCLVVAIAVVAYAAGRSIYPPTASKSSQDGDSSVSARIDALADEMAQQLGDGGISSSTASLADEMASELGDWKPATPPAAPEPKPEPKRLSEDAKARIEQHLLDHPASSDAESRAALAKVHPGWHSEALASAYAEVVKRPCVRAIREQGADALRWRRGLLAGVAVGALALVAYKPTRRRLGVLVMVVLQLASRATPRSPVARRRTGVATLVLLVLMATALFGIYVWPTAWTYPPGSLAMPGNEVRTVQVAKRVNRFTGQVQVLTTGGWKSLPRMEAP